MALVAEDAVAAKDIILDAVIAIVFLVFLAATLPLIVGWFNQLVAPDIGHTPFPLGGTTGYICQVRADPWGQGSWAMLMLISTLFPTALHAPAALTALLVVPAHHLFGSGRIADRLDAIPADYLGGDAAHSATIDDTAWHLTKAWLGVWVVVALLLAALSHLTLPGWLSGAIARSNSEV